MLLNKLKDEYYEKIKSKSEEYPALAECIFRALKENDYVLNLTFEELGYIRDLAGLNKIDDIYWIFDV